MYNELTLYSSIYVYYFCKNISYFSLRIKQNLIFNNYLIKIFNL